MNHKIIAQTFLGNFSVPLSVVPVFEAEYCKNFFDHISNTGYGFNANEQKLTISCRGDTSTIDNAVVLTPVSIQITLTDISKLSSVLEKIHNKLKTYYNELDFSFSTYSLAIEGESADFAETSNVWLTEKFINKGIPFSELPDAIVDFGTLSFYIKTTDIRDFWVNIQPRVGNPKTVYFSISENRKKSLKEESISSIFKDFPPFLEFVENKVLKSIGL